MNKGDYVRLKKQKGPKVNCNNKGLTIILLHITHFIKTYLHDILGLN